MLPVKVLLEACTLCQLNCTGCYMRHRNYCGRGAGYLKFDDFAAFLKLNPQVKEIELANSGEILLNPDLDKIIAHAFSNGVKLSALHGVNFNNVSPVTLENMVKYGFEIIQIPFDGWNQETYTQYRRNGNFDNVIANIRLLNQFKEKYKSEKPRLICKYIIFEHNDDANGARKAEKLARSMGMDFHFSKDWSGYEPKNIKSSDPEKNIFDGWKIPCSHQWVSPQINWDGRFFGCCANDIAPDDTNDHNNLFKVPLSEYMERIYIKDIKQTLLGKKPVCDLRINCKNCRYYQDMAVAHGQVTDEDMQNGGWIIYN